MIEGNALAQEKSLYLQQHAGNPVWWQPWSDAALAEARAQDKPVLLSIGYSACHWCHVMEHESFEQHEVAAVMNEHFVCIKLDREERPDVDMVYMSAVQAMGVRGGWPLNVFLLPDGSPFYGGTYYPKKTWLQLLSDISAAWENNRDAIVKAGTQVREGIRDESSLFKPSETGEPNLKKSVSHLSKTFDREQGGLQGAPKFPTPAVYRFLLEYGLIYKNRDLLHFVDKTLLGMAGGGLYDILGGGFCRYSVDAFWFVPHFEKMLYDNGQLLSLYSEAARWGRGAFFQTIAAETVQFLKREFLDVSGLFYSALDADTEGREGGYYTFKWSELAELSPEEKQMAQKHFGFTEDGNWGEEHANIPVDYFVGVEENPARSFRHHEPSVRVKEHLLAIRDRRTRPGLDRKHIVCWNALTSAGLCEYYKASGDKDALTMARRCLEAIETEATLNGRLLHQAGKEKPIYAFLDDYAALGNACMSLLEATGEERYYTKAYALAEEMLELFEPNEEGLYPYVSRLGQRLIVEKAEVFDSVIPSANSMTYEFFNMMALLSEDARLMEAAQRLAAYGATLTTRDIRFSANWAKTLLNHKERYIVAATGPGSREIITQIKNRMEAGPAFLLWAEKSSGIPYLHQKTAGEPAIYVCKGTICLQPFRTIDEALAAMSAWGPDED